MQEERAQSPTPPEDLRPAQLGIVLLGRVILGHISATLVDLAQRGFLRIDAIPGDDDPDWLLTSLGDQAADRSVLLRFEATLLDGLFARQSAVRVSEISQELILPALDQVRAQLRRDAVRHGRLRPWRRDQRTPRGEQLLQQIQVFRRELRALAASGNPGALAGLAPYAMVFGLGVPSAVSFDAHDTRTAQRRETEAPWSQSDRFATSWLTACAGFSADLRHGHRHQSGTARSDDFAHEWSAPRDHSHGSHSHDLGHGGYSGGHGDLGGGHGAGLGGGGHGGH